MIKHYVALITAFLLPLIAPAQNTFPTSGNVGINTTTPTAPLNVVGNIRVTSPVGYPYGVNIDFASPTPWAREFSFSNASAGKLFAFGAYGLGNDSLNYGYIGGADTSPLVYSRPWMVFRPNGNIGIGTTTPGTNKLAVEGTIAAREVKVMNGSWADFVFAADYKLKPLSELEAYIRQHSHLPEIPTAAEVKRDGISLGAMDQKLLQKIEELTIYLIDEHKRNNQLQEEITILKQQMAKAALPEACNK